MRLIRPGSTLLLLCAACVAVVPSCYRIEITLDRFDVGGAAGEAAGGATGTAGQPAELGDAGSLGAADSLFIGRVCESDLECGDSTGLSCLRASSSDAALGTPAGGLCTAECQADADCRRFGQTAVCGSFEEPPLSAGAAPAGSKRWCLQGCTLGTQGAKCRNRTDVACRPFARLGAEECNTAPCADGSLCFRGLCRAMACGPRCSGDDDCPTDRKCSAQTGLCETQAEPFGQFGKQCSGAGAPELCGDGVCLTFVGGGDAAREICTESCTLGSSCAQGAGACIEPRFEQYAEGDIGYCAQTCNCDGDCLYPGDRCYTWKNRNLSRVFGRPGYCQPQRGEASLTDCTPGGASFE